MRLTILIKFLFTSVLIGVSIVSALPELCSAQSLSSDFYAIGSPNLTDYFVDPESGSDSNNGSSRTAAKRTVASIWNSIPEGQALTEGIRINLLPGTYGSNHLPNYWENRQGTATNPIIIRSADGASTVTFSRDINMANVSYFYLIGVTIKNKTTDGYGDAFHCEQCDHILLRGSSFNGAPSGRSAGGDIAHETVKFNQSQYIYIENNNIQGADDNAIDWVSVQYGHIRGNRIHDTDGWCTYVKGGSSYVLIEGNIAYNCGEGGITAGQGTGLEFMVAPWLRYEANYIKIVNNIVYDIQGAALGVNGGYGILLAHNTAYRTGSRSHLVEVVFGERSCDGDAAACASRIAQGAWGPASTGSDHAQPVGNQDVVISNNIFYNPAGFTTGSQHLAIYGPRTPTASGIPSPQTTDSGLVIQGNIFWNGDSSMPLGVEDTDQGCQSGNSTCTESQIRSDNRINSLEPDFINPSQSDFRPQSQGALAALVAPSISDIPAINSTLNPISEGERSNQMIREFSGAAGITRPPGAFISASSLNELPSADSSNSTPPDSSNDNQSPEVSIKKSGAKRTKSKISITLNVLATDNDGISMVQATLLSTKEQQLASFSLRKKGSRYIGSKVIRSKTKRIVAQIRATDTLGSSTTKLKRLTVVQ